MFSNIGGKIKILAVVLCGLGMFFTILSVIISASIFHQYTNLILIVFTLIIGLLISWAGSFVLYGFGELIERVSSIDEKMTGISFNDEKKTIPSANYKRVVLYDNPDPTKTFNLDSSPITKCACCGKPTENLIKCRVNDIIGQVDLCEECANKYN